MKMKTITSKESGEERSNRYLLVSFLFLLFALFTMTSLTGSMQYPLEMRALAVAYDMMQSHNYLMPIYNGAPYLHKTPLFFLLLIGGWKLFGVSIWWPRLVQTAIALSIGILFSKILQQLYPQKKVFHQSLLLFSNLFFLIFLMTINFDLMLTLFVLLSMYGLLLLSDGHKKGLFISWLGISLAIFAKGPVGYVFILPAILLHRFWRLPGKFNKKLWYLGVIVALMLSCLVLLTWVVSLHVFKSIPWSFFINQVYGRVFVNHATTFNVHAQPFYFYLLIFPLTLLPWLLLPSFWRSWLNTKNIFSDRGSRLCLVIILSAMVILSFISGKNYNYILPLIPFISILFNHNLQTRYFYFNSLNYYCTFFNCNYFSLNVICLSYYCIALASVFRV